MSSSDGQSSATGVKRKRGRPLCHISRGGCTVRRVSRPGHEGQAETAGDDWTTSAPGDEEFGGSLVPGHGGQAETAGDDDWATSAPGEAQFGGSPPSHGATRKRVRRAGHISPGGCAVRRFTHGQRGDAGAALDDWALSAPWDEEFMDSSVVEGKRGGRFARIGFKETKVSEFKIEVQNFSLVFRLHIWSGGA